MLNDKRGSHVGMVLSFTIFILALVFVYVIVGNPISYNNQKGNPLLTIKNNLVNEIKGDLYAFRVKQNSSCTSISIPTHLTNESVVAWAGETVVASKISGDSIFIDSGSSFVKVFYSGNFVNPSESSESSCSSDKPLSVIKEKKVFEKKIVELIDKLNNNETALRETLNVPSSNELDIIFTYENQTTISGNKNEPKENIYSYNEDIYYYTLNATEEKGELSLRVW